MFKLHEEFKSNRQIITLNKVYIYFNNLHESQQMYLLNYKDDSESNLENRQQMVSEVVDQIVSEVVQDASDS